MNNMKIKTLLLGIAVLFVTVSVSAQTIVSVSPGTGTLESTINADTTATGERNDPNTIYELEPGGVYICNSGVKFDGSTGNLTIRMQSDAPEGSKKPIIVRMKADGVNVSSWSVEGSLTMENIYYNGKEIIDGTEAGSWLFVMTGDNHTLSLDSCVFEFTENLGIFDMLVSSGAKIDIRNSYFRDMNNFKQWWQGRVVECHYPIDEFLFENNTVTGGGLTVCSQGVLYEYMVVNHNTFINNHKYPFLNHYWKECYFTNNLFVNANMVGEDAVNVATGGQDPDGQAPVLNDDGTITTNEMWMGIIGLDTIVAGEIQIQDKFLNSDGTLTDDIDEISDYIFYCADNVVVNSATLDSYYAGETGSWTGVLSSYLTWSGIGTAPFEVGNVPGIWINSRTEALDSDYDNIALENNSIYEYRTSDLGLGTEPLSEEAAEVFINWNQNAWGVPGATKPTDYTAYQFGDYDPATIPGIEVESAGAGEGGIIRISDLVEDFSYTANLTSESDGLMIGSLIWDDLDYDSEASVAAVKAAYNNSIITGIDELIEGTSSELDLKNYPNPFPNSTTISFNLSASSYVSLQVYDITGTLVSQLINEVRNSGLNTVVFTPDYSVSKVFVYRLTTDFGTETKKMMLAK
jgi:hypothetical protein